MVPSGCARLSPSGRPDRSFSGRRSHGPVGAWSTSPGVILPDVREHLAVFTGPAPGDLVFPRPKGVPLQARGADTVITKTIDAHAAARALRWVRSAFCSEASSSSTRQALVRDAQAQVQADAERAMARSQAAHAKLPAAAARNSIAHPTASVVKEPPTSVTAPRPTKTIPAPMRTPAQKRRWRYSHGAIMRCMPDRGGDAHHPRRPLGAVLSLDAFIGVTPVGCDVRPSGHLSK
jgi:hypothetical protein